MSSLEVIGIQTIIIFTILNGVFVGVLKRPKSRLESERHPKVPWPRYSRKWTFWHLGHADLWAS